MKASIKFEKDEIRFLDGFLLEILELTPIEFLELESYCISWLYKRMLNKFAFPSACKLPLLMSEALALKRLLMSWPMTTEYDDFMRNTIIAKIGKKCLQT